MNQHPCQIPGCDSHAAYQCEACGFCACVNHDGEDEPFVFQCDGCGKFVCDARDDDRQTCSEYRDAYGSFCKDCDDEKKWCVCCLELGMCFPGMSGCVTCGDMLCEFCAPRSVTSCSYCKRHTCLKEECDRKWGDLRVCKACEKDVVNLQLCLVAAGFGGAHKELAERIVAFL